MDQRGSELVSEEVVTVAEGCWRRAGLEHAEQWSASRRDVERRRHFCPHRVRTAKSGFSGTSGQPSPSPRSSPSPGERGPLQAHRLPSPGQAPGSLQAGDSAALPRFSASNLDGKVLCFKRRDALIKRQGSSGSRRRGYLRGRGELPRGGKRAGRATKSGGARGWSAGGLRSSPSKKLVNQIPRLESS